LRARLEARIAFLKPGEHIELAGTTPGISEEYRRAQLFVMLSPYERFGLAAAEARSHGFLARALRPLLRSPDLRERLGRRGPLSMASFSKEKICDLWEAMLYECWRT
jgi:hypothetical protein